MPSTLTITPATPAKADSAWLMTEARHQLNSEFLAGIPRDKGSRIALYAWRLRFHTC